MRKSWGRKKKKEKRKLSSHSVKWSRQLDGSDQREPEETTYLLGRSSSGIFGDRTRRSRESTAAEQSATWLCRHTDTVIRPTWHQDSTTQRFNSRRLGTVCHWYTYVIKGGLAVLRALHLTGDRVKWTECCMHHTLRWTLTTDTKEEEGMSYIPEITIHTSETLTAKRQRRKEGQRGWRWNHGSWEKSRQAAGRSAHLRSGAW